MTTRQPVVGTALKAWAERHLDGDTVETFILPAIADLQYEDALAHGRVVPVRWAIRLRGYVGVVEALGVQMATRRGRPVRGSEIAASGAATSGGGRSGDMSESNRSRLLMVAAGALIAAVGFAAGRASVPMDLPVWDTGAGAASAGGIDLESLQRSIESQRREAAERDKRIQQQLDQQRYDADVDRQRAERVRIDAETELARQQTQELINERRRAEDMARARDARERIEAELARQRTERVLDQLGRKW